MTAFTMEVYTKEDLIALKKWLKDVDYVGDGGHASSIIEPINKSVCHPKLFHERLLRRAQRCEACNDQDFIWAKALFFFMYQAPLEDMPLYVNMPLYSEVVNLRLEKGV